MDLYSNGKWIVAKYHSNCKCGQHINPGDDLWFIPYKKETWCTKCGHSLYPPALKKLLNIL